MNWDQVEGQWKTLKGAVKAKWGKLTDDDIEIIAGKKDQLMGRLQSLYGMKKEKAEEELDKFLSGIKSKADEFKSDLKNKLN